MFSGQNFTDNFLNGMDEDIPVIPEADGRKVGHGYLGVAQIHGYKKLDVAHGILALTLQLLHGFLNQRTQGKQTRAKILNGIIAVHQLKGLVVPGIGMTFVVHGYRYGAEHSEYSASCGGALSESVHRRSLL